MTLEELQILCASHERQIAMMNENLRLQAELARVQSGNIDKVSKDVAELVAVVNAHQSHIEALRQDFRDLLAALVRGNRNGKEDGA